MKDFSLMFLPNLKTLALTDVDLETIINISTFCPQLTSLSLHKSEVNSYRSGSSDIEGCLLLGE